MIDEKKPITFEHVLYGNALQMALTIAGKKPDYSGKYPNNDLVIKHLEHHKNMANIIYDYLLNQF